MVADVDLLIIKQHPVDGLDGGFTGFLGLVMDISIALGAPVLISDDLAGQDIAESSEGIVKGLCIEAFLSMVG